MSTSTVATAVHIDDASSPTPRPRLYTIPQRYQAHLTILGGFLALFCSFGQLNAFGTFQAWYATHQLRTTPASTISWIGSLQLWIFFFSGCPIGHLFDVYGPTWLMLSGTICFVSSLMLTSISSKYWEYILSQGVLFGLGVGLLFYPSLASISTHFSTYRATALGIAIAGSGLGGVIYPILFQHLFQTLGFGWGVRIAGFTSLIGCGLSVLLVSSKKNHISPGDDHENQLQSRASKQNPTRLLEKADFGDDDHPACTTQGEQDIGEFKISRDVFHDRGPTEIDFPTLEKVRDGCTRESSTRVTMWCKLCGLCGIIDLKFGLLAAGSSFVAFGLFIPFFYIVSYTKHLHHSSSTQTYIYILSTMNAGSVVGRLLPAYLSDTLGRFNLLFPSALLAGLSTLVLWGTANGTTGVVAYAAIYGFWSGAFISLVTPCVAGLCDSRDSRPKVEKLEGGLDVDAESAPSKGPETHVLGTKIGLLYTIISFPSLLGNPIAGWLLSHTQTSAPNSFTPLIIFSGSTIVVGSLFILGVRLALDKRLWVKV